MGSGVNYQQLTGTIGQASSAAEGKLQGFMKTMDPGNAGDMIKFQSLSQQWSLAVNLESSSVKMIGDALKGVVQKIG